MRPGFSIFIILCAVAHGFQVLPRKGEDPITSLNSAFQDIREEFRFYRLLTPKFEEKLRYFYSGSQSVPIQMDTPPWNGFDITLAKTSNFLFNHHRKKEMDLYALRALLNDLVYRDFYKQKALGKLDQKLVNSLEKESFRVSKLSINLVNTKNEILPISEMIQKRPSLAQELLIDQLVKNEVEKIIQTLVISRHVFIKNWDLKSFYPEKLLELKGRFLKPGSPLVYSHKPKLGVLTKKGAVYLQIPLDISKELIAAFSDQFQYLDQESSDQEGVLKKMNKAFTLRNLLRDRRLNYLKKLAREAQEFKIQDSTFLTEDEIYGP